MSITQIIQVAIGLVLVYYLLGLIVSFISSRILETFQTRGTILEGYLKEIVGTTQVNELLALPQIKSLAPIRYDRWWGVIAPRVKETKIETIPVANLVDAFFDLGKLVQKPYAGDELKKVIHDLPDSEIKTNLVKLVGTGVSSVELLRARSTMWMNGLMDQAAATYKAYARRYVIFLALVVTLLFGVDSIDLATQLWQSADVRALADAKATKLVQDQSTTDISVLVKDLGDLSLKIGWWSLPQNQPKPEDNVFLWVIKKIAGLAITFVAVSQGSSFWYDILRKFKGESTSTDNASTAPEGQAAT